ASGCPRSRARTAPARRRPSRPGRRAARRPRMGIFDRIAGSLDGLGQRADGPAAAKEEIELAMGFADRGDLQEAEQRLRSITERFPRLPLGFARMGELLTRRGGDDDAAAVAYGRAVDLDPDDLESWFGLGETLARLG